MGNDPVRGRCLCGQLKYRAAKGPLWTALCHCESCRRAASAPVVAWMGFDVREVEWDGDRRLFQSSAHATRGFCPACGSQMSFESARWPGEVHLYAVTRDDPQNYRPQLHCYTAEHLPWLTIDDDLPRFAGTAELDDGAH